MDIEMLKTITYDEYIALLKCKDVTIRGTAFVFLGKGGESVVYKMGEYAIKIFKQKVKHNINTFVYDKTNILLANKVTTNFLRLVSTFKVFGRDVYVLPYVTGTLEQWTYTKHTDEEWINMINQILSAIDVMQKQLQMYHGDLKPKNILYKGETFYISDFGHASSLLWNHNKIPKESIILAIKSNKDMEHLATLHKRLAVTILQNTYSTSELLEFGKGLNNFSSYVDNEKRYITKHMGNYNDNVRDHMLSRSLIYFLIENKKFDIYDLPASQIQMPSRKIMDILNDIPLGANKKC